MIKKSFLLNLGKFKQQLAVGLLLYTALSISSLVSLGHFRLWETFTYPSYGGLMLLLTLAGLSSMWLSIHWAKHPHTNGLLASIWALVLPFSGLAAMFFIFGWWYSRPFFFIFFTILFIGVFIYQIIRNKRVIRVASTSPEVTEVLEAAVQWATNARKIKITSVDNPDSFDIVVTDLRHNPSSIPAHLLSNLAAEGKQVVDVTSFIEELTGKVDISSLSEEAEYLLRPKGYIGIKRIWETAVIILTAPMWLLLALVVAILVRIDSRGPIIFKQRRIGLYGVPFDMFKFRSMHVNSEANGPSFAQVGDKRITRVGAILRKFRLDEIPQLWNVLKGEMSLIGPRPEQEVFVTKFSQEIPFFETRHFVRPGLTGWAQVMLGYTADSSGAKEKLAYDLYYIKNFSFWLDLLIILKTLLVIFRGFGAR